MRVPAFVSFVLCLLATPAFAAVNFLGHGAGGGGQISVGWSSDLGPGDGTQFPAIPGGAGGFTDSASISRTVGTGEVGGRTWLRVAPTGAVNLSAPTMTYVAYAFSHDGDGMYGLAANTNHSSTIVFSPFAGGGLTYYALAWHVSSRVTGGSVGSWAIALGYSTLSTTGGDTVGVTFGTVPESYPGLNNVHAESGAGTPAGYGGSADVTVTLNLYLDGSPIAGVDGITAPAALEFAAPRPNPARDGATFAFALPAQGEVSLQVLDVSGRVVRELLPGELPAGRHELRWDRRDASGGVAKPGVYWARLALAHGDRTDTARQRLVVID